MEANLKTEKITHQLHTIQFTDKAIENLRWNKGTEKRQRIKVKFKNGEIFIIIFDKCLIFSSK